MLLLCAKAKVLTRPSTLHPHDLTVSCSPLWLSSSDRPPAFPLFLEHTECLVLRSKRWGPLLGMSFPPGASQLPSQVSTHTPPSQRICLHHTHPSRTKSFCSAPFFSCSLYYLLTQCVIHLSCLSVVGLLSLCRSPPDRQLCL